MSLELQEETNRRLTQRQGLPHFVIYAGFVSRTLATAIDLLIIVTVWLVGGLTMWFIGQTSGLNQIVDWVRGFFAWVTPIQEFVASTAYAIIVLLVIGQIYFTFFYAFGGATPGKYLLGLKVLRSDGRPLSGAQAALRTVAYAASALPIYLGFFNVLLDDRRRAWHDILTRTVVVHSWRARPDEVFLRHAIDRLEQRNR